MDKTFRKTLENIINVCTKYKNKEFDELEFCCRLGVSPWSESDPEHFIYHNLVEVDLELCYLSIEANEDHHAVYRYKRQKNDKYADYRYKEGCRIADELIQLTENFLLHSKNVTHRTRCQCCGNYPFESRGDALVEVCKICFWLCDEKSNERSNEISITNKISLEQARQSYTKYGVCDIQYKDHVRKPLREELPENNN